MAKEGIVIGDKIDILGKQYRILNDIIDIHSVLGELKFGKIEGSNLVYEEQRQADGTVENVNTGEVRGVDVTIRYGAQSESDTVTITDMSEYEISELGLKLFDPIDLIDPVLTYSFVDNNEVYKFFASGIRKKTVSVAPAAESKKEEQQSKQPGNVKN